LWILELSWNIELDFSVSVFEFRQLSYLFENATRMPPEDRSLFVETSLRPFYAKILVEKLLQGFLKSLGDDEDSSVPCTIEPPPLTAEDFKRQEDAHRVSRSFIISRLKTFGVSPLATTVIIAPLTILSSRASNIDSPLIVTDQPLVISSLLSSSVDDDLVLGSLLSTSFVDRVIALDDDHGIDSISSKPLGLGSRVPRPADNGVSSRLSPSIDNRVIDDDHGINSIPSKPPELSSRLSRPVDNCCVSIALDDLEPFGLSSCPSPVVDRVIALDDDHGIDSISSKPLGLGSRVPRPADNCVSITLDDLEPLARVTDDHGIDSIEDRVIAINDDHGINFIPSKPPGFGSRLSTVADNPVLNEPRELSILSKSPKFNLLINEDSISSQPLL
jgi:hypothetical protein